MKISDCHIAHPGGQGDHLQKNRFGESRAGTGTRPYGGDAGVTLIELIVAMVVISVALTGVMLVINYTTLHSADPVLRHQAIAIAEAYMEEITLKNYNDPDTNNLCPVREASRALYDNVCDYNALPDSSVTDQSGNAIGGLGNYSVNVIVSNPEVDFGPAGQTIKGLQIDVTVVDPAGESLTLTGFRAAY